MAAETLIFSFPALSTYNSAWHVETLLLLLLVFLTSCFIHSAQNSTAQCMGFLCSVTKWTESHEVAYMPFGFRQLFC